MCDANVGSAMLLHVQSISGNAYGAGLVSSRGVTAAHSGFERALGAYGARSKAAILAYRAL